MSRTTTDHDEIRKWVEDNGRRPAVIPGTGGPQDPGVLTLDFHDGELVEPIAWDAFFKDFDSKRLEFFYRDQPAGAEDATLFRFLVKDEAAP